MAEEVLLRERREGVLVLTLNRPDRLNALNGALMRALLEAAGEAAEDREVGAVVLRGAGRAFCAGGDIGGGGERKSTEAKREPDPPEARKAWLRKNVEAARLLHEMPKPTIAMLHGAAAGAGLCLAAACDFRIASEDATFLTAFIKVGFSGDYGGTYFLTSLLGSAKARELYLLSPVLTAKEAFDLGMVSKVVPDAEVEEASRELAMSLAHGPSIALGFIKRNINNAETMSLEACFDGEAIHHSRAGETADHKEAAKAFVEKRKPAFQGQ